MQVTPKLIIDRLNLGKPIIRPKEMTNDQKLLIYAFLTDRFKDAMKAAHKAERMMGDNCPPGIAGQLLHWRKVAGVCKYHMDMIFPEGVPPDA